ncbi:MAG: prephenate dehydrogenase/arogenate dehydrogenase family protein, partial [Thermoplasmata archaeon]|nr:prephenate dehydrogenase/arogenate dehydrogenase family protein [Thermoplasmata archaeon]
MADDELVRLRAGLARADDEICRAIGRRLDLARRIGQVKIRNGIPIRNPAVEREVVARWSRGLEALGVSGEQAERLARWLVEEAVRVQESARPPPARPHRKAGRVLVVGGAGSMGRWLVEFLRSRDYQVEVVDPAARSRGGPGRPPSLEAAAAAADIVLIATPMRVATGIYDRLWKTTTRAVVIDILSVKAPILRKIREGRAKGFQVASVHPLFGPSARTLSGRNLLVLDCGDAKATSTARSLFEGTALTITRMPIDRHDALMADLQALPRATSLLFAQTLVESGRTRSALERAETTSFHRELQVAREVLAERPELGLDIQALNPS